MTMWFLKHYLDVLFIKFSFSGYLQCFIFYLIYQEAWSQFWDAFFKIICMECIFAGNLRNILWNCSQVLHEIYIYMLFNYISIPSGCADSIHSRRRFLDGESELARSLCLSPIITAVGLKTRVSISCNHHVGHILTTLPHILIYCTYKTDTHMGYGITD